MHLKNDAPTIHKGKPVIEINMVYRILWLVYPTGFMKLVTVRLCPFILWSLCFSWSKWLFTVLRSAQEFFTYMETSPFPVSKINIILYEDTDTSYNNKAKKFAQVQNILRARHRIIIRGGLYNDKRIFICKYCFISSALDPPPLILLVSELHIWCMMRCTDIMNLKRKISDWCR
jgi:hypothetical protein